MNPPIRYIAAAAAVVLSLVAVLLLLPRLVGVLVLTFLAVLIAVLLDYPVSLLSRRMRRGYATALVGLAVFAALGAALLVAIPPLVQEGQQLMSSLPRALERLRQWWPGQAPDPTSVDPQQVVSQAVPLAITGVSGFFAAVLVLILALFLVYEPQTYTRGIVRLVPPAHRGRAEEILPQLGRTLQRWMAGRLIAMAFVGVLTGIGLAIAGVPGWPVLAVLMFVADFVPYVGPIAAAVPGLLVALTASPQTALWALAVYLVVQQLENNLIQPMVMKQAVRIRPAVLLVWQAVVGAAFGVFALLVATPLLACLQVLVERLYVRRIEEV